MHHACNEITKLKLQAQASTKTIVDLRAQNEELTKSKADLEERYEAAKVHRERRVEATIFSKDRNMEGKDLEIAEFKRRLRESQEKVDSLEIDVEAEKERAESAIEAHNVFQAALDVAWDNYTEIQSVNNSECLQQYGISYVANAFLNSVELDQTVAALIVAAHHCNGER
ncbi:hypothetical protein Hanom_Chr09g00781001 [Helianthus anomalus]